MKKVLVLACLALGVSLQSNAQVESAYRPSAGNQTLEFSLAPLGGTPVSLPGGGIKWRSFSDQNTAIRLGAYVGLMTTSEITQQEDEDVNELRDRTSEFSISVQPGMEWHMTGTERLSPYVGAFLNLGWSTSNDKSEYDRMELDGDGIPTGEMVVEETSDKTGTLNLGLFGVAGFDYYIAEKLFLGAEMGFGVGYNKDLTRTMSDSAPDTDDVELKGGSSLNIAPIVVGQLRLGFVF